MESHVSHLKINVFKKSEIRTYLLKREIPFAGLTKREIEEKNE